MDLLEAARQGNGPRVEVAPAYAAAARRVNVRNPVHDRTSILAISRDGSRRSS
jgi:hypothetical protein